MGSIPKHGNDAATHERAISLLTELTGASLTDVRVQFAQEFARLEPGAKVRSYLSLLTASNVRAMFRRKT